MYVCMYVYIYKILYAFLFENVTKYQLNDKTIKIWLTLHVFFRSVFYVFSLITAFLKKKTHQVNIYKVKMSKNVAVNYFNHLIYKIYKIK